MSTRTPLQLKQEVERQNRRNRQRRLLGLCYRCGSPLDGSKSYCSACSEKIKKYRVPYDKERYDQRKSLGLCPICGEKRDLQNLRCRTCAHKQRWRKAKRLYGISPEQFSMLESLQGGKCAICGEIPEEGLCIDHDHVNGKVRGLLCRVCNSAIGKLGDSVERLQAAIRYLTSHAS